MNVKVCFVMDCTASMGPWIRQAKTRLADIMDSVRMQHPHTVITTAFVGYRDYGDENALIVHPFMQPEEIMRLIQPIEAFGGDDEAEDVANGLERALHLDWSNSDVRMVFHIADAPAHGIEFHSIMVSDQYPRGDPFGLDPRDMVERMSFLDIDYTFLKITSKTDLMLDVFARCYVQGGTFRVVDLHPQDFDDGDSMPSTIVDILSQTITQHTSSQEQ